MHGSPVFLSKVCTFLIYLSRSSIADKDSSIIITSICKVMANIIFFIS